MNDTAGEDSVLDVLCASPLERVKKPALLAPPAPRYKRSENFSYFPLDVEDCSQGFKPGTPY